MGIAHWACFQIEFQLSIHTEECRAAFHFHQRKHPTDLLCVRQEITLWRQGERARRAVKSAGQHPDDHQEPPTPVTICNIQQQLMDGNIQQRPSTLHTVSGGYRVHQGLRRGLAPLA